MLIDKLFPKPKKLDEVCADCGHSKEYHFEKSGGNICGGGCQLWFVSSMSSCKGWRTR